MIIGATFILRWSGLLSLSEGSALCKYVYISNSRRMPFLPIQSLLSCAPPPGPVLQNLPESWDTIFFANDNHDNATPPMTLLSHIFGDCYLICMKSLAVSHSLHCESQLQVTQSGFRLIWWNRKVTKTSFTIVGQGETPSLHQCEQRINVCSGTLALVWWSWCAPWGCTTKCNCSVWLGGSKVQLLEHWAAQ